MKPGHNRAKHDPIMPNPNPIFPCRSFSCRVRGSCQKLSSLTIYTTENSHLCKMNRIMAYIDDREREREREREGGGGRF
jgi:hypothetical protein